MPKYINWKGLGGLFGAAREKHWNSIKSGHEPGLLGLLLQILSLEFNDKIYPWKSLQF